MSNELVEIFQAQEKLARKFYEIEVANGFHSGPWRDPLDLNDFHDQHRLRNNAWRIQEELAELKVAIESPEERLGELSDVLHFLVEFSILAGYTPTKMPENPLEYFLSSRVKYSNFNEAWINISVNLGLAVNQLKNRPWKQTNKPTNTADFYARLTCIWLAFASVCRMLNIVTPAEVHQLYFNKNKINQERIAHGI